MWEDSTMTPENKSTMYWTGGAMAAIVVLIVILWAIGLFEAAPVQ